MEPLISVIVPVYNVAGYLPRCFRAISEQTYHNLEIIFVDDGSDDGSGDLCEEFADNDPRVRVIHQLNLGAGEARNSGHDVANGEYLFFPDADDDFSRDLISVLYKAIISRSGYDLAICRMVKTWAPPPNISSTGSMHITEKNQEELFRNLFGRDNEPYAIFLWNKLFRASLVSSLRMNPYPRSEDKDYMIRLIPMIDKAILVEDRLYYWIQHRDSLTHAPEAKYLFNESMARISYRNLLTLPDSVKRFRHYLLEELYPRMLFWKSLALKKPEFPAVASECRIMLRNTLKDYVFCREIPFWKRIVSPLLMISPRLVSLLMNLTNNNAK